MGDLMLNVNDVESKTKPVACPIDVILISHCWDDLRNRYFVYKPSDALYINGDSCHLNKLVIIYH